MEILEPMQMSVDEEEEVLSFPAGLTVVLLTTAQRDVCWKSS